jgi:hypothetical protein
LFLPQTGTGVAPPQQLHSAIFYLDQARRMQPLFQIFLFAVLGCILLGTLLVMLIVSRSMLGSRVGTRQTLLAAPFLLGTALIALLLYLTTSETDRRSAWTAFQLGAPIIFWGVELVSLRRRKRAGAVLLDLGHTPGYSISLPLGGMWIIITLVQLTLYIVVDNLKAQAVVEAFFNFSLGMLSIISGLRKVQIREGGFLYQQLIPWKKIRSYTWEDDNPNTLTLSVKTTFPFFDERSFLIPAARRDDVDRLLRRYVPRSPVLSHDQTPP